MSTTRYYQLGGFRPDIRWFEGDWNDKKIVDLLAGPDSPLRPTPEHPLEFILGIKHKGTSHLLLADTQASAFERTAKKKKPYKFSTIDDYTSVSPIYFHSAEELKKKLGLLKPKVRKGGKKEDPWDTSQANKSFTDGDRGVWRGEFEHGRVLFRLLRNTINPTLYSIQDASWCADLRVVSFACNLRAVDSRPYEEKQQSPRPLDYGWAEANVLDPKLTLKPGSATHFVRAKDRLLGTGRPNASFEHGKSQIETQEDIASSAQQFFSAFTSQEERVDDGPTILLVYDEKLARNALRELGVQTETWTSGIDTLLRQGVKLENPRTHQRPTGPGSSSNPAAYRSPPTNFDVRRQRPRDRSRSPPRKMIKPDPDQPTRHQPPLQGRTRSPPPQQRRKFAPVYIIDVQALYRTMMQSQSGKLLWEVVHKLGVSSSVESGWCAGNEAVCLFQVWHSMVSGSAIDEQRASSMGSSTATQQATGVQAQQQQSLASSYDDDEEDDEFDPNDIVQISSSNVAPQMGGGSDDSDTDYGSDY